VSTAGASVVTRLILTVSSLSKLKLECDIRPLFSIHKESNFILIFIPNMWRKLRKHVYSLVGIIIRLQSGWPTNRGLIPVKVQSVQTYSEAQPSSYLICAASLRIKRLGCETGYSFPHSFEVRNAWSRTSTFSVIFMAWLGWRQGQF
jgi:hypothetical protein